MFVRQSSDRKLFCAVINGGTEYIAVKNIVFFNEKKQKQSNQPAVIIVNN